MACEPVYSGACGSGIAGVLAAYAVGLGAVWWVANPGGADVRVHLPGPLMALVRAARPFLAAARPLLVLRTLRANVVPVVLSLAIVAGDVWLLGRAVGISDFSLRDAAVAYGFSTLILVLTPVPTLVLLRFLLTGATMLLTGPLVLVLSRRLRPPRALVSSAQVRPPH